jgi:dihydroorotase
MKSIVISDVKLSDGSSVSIGMRAGVITEIGTQISSDYDETILGTGLTALPGFVDLHTHLREPGKEDAETVLTGSQSAVAGGFTAVSAMANTNPVADTAGLVEQVFRLGKEAGLCEVFPIGAVSKGLMGEQLAELGAMATSAASVRIFSDDGKCISDPLLMRRALEYVKSFNGLIAQHAQDPRLTVNAQMNEGEISSTLGLAGWPAVAEESIIARDILLADHVQSRLHICHVSTAGSVELIRWAKSRGISVTAEVTPHHLLLTEDLITGYDPIYKVNPPLRSQRDVEALRTGLADGTIDIVATDHAPHPREDKDCEWAAAAFGMTGLETAFSVVFTAMVKSGLMSLDRLVEVMSTAPARIGGYIGQGSLAIGSPAHITLVDLASDYPVNARSHLSKSSNSPFNGLVLSGRVRDTLFHGVAVLRNGTLTGERFA